MKANTLPDIEYLNEIFEADFDNGKLYWKQDRNRGLTGKEAGYYSKATGYIRVNLDCKIYQLHRILYYMCNPDMTQNNVVDHINGDKSDNRISNLRIATKQQNCKHQTKLHPQNTTGYRNVLKIKRTRPNGEEYFMFRVELRNKGKHVKTKTFQPTEQGLKHAIKWRDYQESLLHGNFIAKKFIDINI